MHPYSINSNERSTIQLILAGASIVLTYLLKNTLEFPWWIEDPSIFGIYGLLYLIFNRYLWKIDILHSIGLVQTPKIYGNWIGQIRSSFDHFENLLDTKLVIRQNWTNIDVSFSTLTSKGKSVIASINVENDEDIELTYTYVNEPIASAKSGMKIHKGTSTLCFTDNMLLAKGDYYSGRGRTQYGEIELKKLQ